MRLHSARLHSAASSRSVSKCWSMLGGGGGGCAALLPALLLLMLMLPPLLLLLSLLLLLLSLLLLLLLLLPLLLLPPPPPLRLLRRRSALDDVAIAFAMHGPSSSAPCSTMRWPIVRRLFRYGCVHASSPPPVTCLSHMPVALWALFEHSG